LWVLLAALVALLLAGALWWLVADDGGLARFRRDATWAKMQEIGEFRVGLDPSFPPFESLDGAGRPVGYDVDLAQALANRWGLELKLYAMGYDSLVDAVLATRVHAVISAMPYDERMTRDLAISPAYFEAGLRLAVAPSSTIGGAQDLGGARVAVEWGSAGDMVARRLLRAAPADNEWAPTAPFTIVQYDTPDETLQAAASGDADAVLVDAVSLRLAQGQGSPLVAVGPVLEANPYVILSPRRATTLAEAIENGLAELEADGTLSRLEERWFGPAALPLSAPQP
jgi:ABC-type amino acid transport substrate-binding protein